MADIPGYTPKKIDRSGSNSDFTAFWPLVLLTLSFIVLVGWQVMVATEIRDNVTRIRDQQVKLVEQSKRVQTGLQKFARDLLDVSKSDADAKAIVDKYGIVANAPATAPAASPAGQ